MVCDDRLIFEGIFFCVSLVSSSDDGNFFIWERPTNMVTEVLSADKSIVNCVQPHPFCCLVATSGIDHEIRLWSPQPEDASRSLKADHVDLTVNENQQRMQSDPFEMATGPVCRTS
jgi:WD and tetratricopeptide repeats protein 1